jgi:hypothetical protein
MKLTQPSEPANQPFRMTGMRSGFEHLNCKFTGNIRETEPLRREMKPLRLATEYIFRKTEHLRLTTEPLRRESEHLRRGTEWHYSLINLEKRKTENLKMSILAT